MKKVVLGLSIAFCLVIVFFTFFGESLYYSTNPEVELDYSFRVNEDMYLPKGAVFEEADGAYIYTVESQPGFSAEILTVVRHKLVSYSPDGTGYFDGYVIVVPEERINGQFVVSSTEPLSDGMRVVEKE